MCRSWSHNGFILDTGPHIFHTPDEELKKFWKANFNDLLVEGKFYCKNVQGDKFDKFYDYPFSLEALNNFDIKFALIELYLFWHKEKFHLNRLHY